MESTPYTLATYHVKAGREEEFIRAWADLADTFSSLPAPPLWGTLVRSRTERTLFHSFGPWRSHDDVRAMRESPAAMAAFQRLHELCGAMSPGDFDLVVHVDVEAG